eukprot:928829_1
MSASEVEYPFSFTRGSPNIMGCRQSSKLHSDVAEDPTRSSSKRMGCRQSSKLDGDLAEEQTVQEDRTCLLFLGAGESGKSTFLKQCREIYNNSRSEEFEFAKNSIVQMLIEVSIKLRRLLHETMGEAARNAVSAMSDLSADINPTNRFTYSHADNLRAIWADPAVQDILINRNTEVPSITSVAYFIDGRLDALADPEFEPTFEDHVRCRVKTTGVNFLDFQFDNMPIQMIDVGGQRSERRKWIDQFDSAAAILFVASLTGYSETLEEDFVTNRLTESLTLIGDTIQYDALEGKPLIILLNKEDLLQERMEHHKLSDFFPEFKGDNSSTTDVKDFIEKKFRDVMDSSLHKCEYTVHYTSAIDTDKTHQVFQEILQKVIEEKVRESGFM